ncbi:hypothetical protein H5410_055973 [Solanum commersonii]|uniref:Uncharacterized protein n=1 Tax=Solanum commersonii TaxID=4109 RepID=A0A9J5WKR3_SOLCO|nr:hypothetical protein H5410_055973 [Solanum commersonii]
MDHRLWMYNMHYETGACLKPEFIDGEKSYGCRNYENGKIVKPKADFSFTLDEKREIIERNRPNRNDEGDIDPLFPPISIFNQNGEDLKA